MPPFRPFRPLTRRALLAAAAVAAAATWLPQAASAQQIQQLKIMAPAAPGGGWDSTARQMQAAISGAGIVRNVQVTNVPGAGGTIGLASLVNNMKGDGSQLMVNGLVMVGAILTNKSPVTLAQTTPIARLTGEYEIVVVPAASPIRDMKQLAERLKDNPGAVAIAGGSAGGTDHILAGLIVKAVGGDPTKMNYVPFSGGGEALAAILGNHVAAGISGIGEFAAQIKAGRLRAIAVSSPQRIPGLDVPTLREQGVDVELANWRAVVAPPGISPQQRQALIEVVDRMVKSPQWQETLKKNDWANMYLSGDQFAAFLREEDARITDVLKTIGLVK